MIAIEGKLNRAPAHTESSSELANLSVRPTVFGSEPINLIPSQSVIYRFFSNVNPNSSPNRSLFNRVSPIFEVCSKVKMLWIDARRVVLNWTVVENLHSFWNWTIVKYPACSVGQNVTTTHSNRSVSKRHFVSGPYPAPNRAGILVHLGPKSHWEVVGKTLRAEVFDSNFDHKLSNRLVLLTGERGAFSF